jgi:hypothetical protein
MNSFGEFERNIFSLVLKQVWFQMSKNHSLRKFLGKPIFHLNQGVAVGFVLCFEALGQLFLTAWQDNIVHYNAIQDGFCFRNISG